MFTITPYEKRAFDLFGEFEKEFFNLGKAVQGHCKTDIRDEGDKFVLEMETPGFEKEEVAIDVKGDYLTITANKKAETKTSETETENGKYIRRERFGGSYQRGFDISGIDAEKITAEYKNGVLIVDLPKKGKVSPESRRLEIK